MTRLISAAELLAQSPAVTQRKSLESTSLQQMKTNSIPAWLQRYQQI